MIFSVLAILGSVLLCFLKMPKSDVKMENKLNPSSASDRMITDETKEGAEKPALEFIKDTFRMLISGRMLYVIPLIIWSGLSMAFFAGIFIPLMTRSMKNSLDINPDLDTDDNRSVAALLTFIFLGIGEILGGILFIGPIRDKFGNRIAYFI